MSALIVALEGIDGSGKGTQAARVRDALQAEGRNVGLIGFPRYAETEGGRRIAEYLNSERGALATAEPRYVARLFAMDRHESLPLIDYELAARDILLFDRYMPSNLAHQAARLPARKRDDFLRWLEHLEYDDFRIPRPDLVVFLDMPVAEAQRLIALKPRRQYTQKAADLHEADSEHLRLTSEVYKLLAARDSSWRTVPCVGPDGLLPPDAITRVIVDLVKQAERAPR